MTHDISNPTHLLMSRKCEFYYSAGNCFAHVADCGVKALAATLDAFDEVDIAVEYRRSGTPEQQERDLRTFTNRIRNLPPWYLFSGFNPKVINGFKQATMTGRLQRVLPCQD